MYFHVNWSKSAHFAHFCRVRRNPCFAATKRGRGGKQARLARVLFCYYRGTIPKGRLSWGPSRARNQFGGDLFEKYPKFVGFSFDPIDFSLISIEIH